MKNFYPLLLSLCLVSFLLYLVSCKKISEKGDFDQTQQNPVICGSTLNSNGIQNLPTPKFRTGIGNSQMAISTKNKEAQRWFDQGLNHLHGFWHLEAFRAFQQVIKLDPKCAMGHWGVAMCQPGFGGSDNSTWVQAIDKAVALQNGVSPLEKGLIGATVLLVKQGLNDATIEKFRTLYKTYPNESEAIAFAAIMLRQDTKETTQQEVKALLEKSMRRFPDHIALMHYYVHVMELRPEFSMAVSIAEKMTKLAPNSPHLTHMPGHLYYLAGQYEKAIKAYTAAQKQETAYHNAEKIPFSANQNYVHNLHFLAVAQAEAAQKQEALATATTLSNLTLSATVPNAGAEIMMLYEGRILPALVHIRFREFKEASDKLSFWLNSVDVPLTHPLVRLYLQGMQAYCKGMSAVEQNNIAEAIAQGGQLTQLIQAFEQAGIQYQQSPEFKNINETYDILSMARYELAGWIDNIDKTKPFSDTAWKEAITLQNAIKYDEPPRLMYPIEESLGQLHLRRGEHKEAKKAFELALAKRPKSPFVQTLKTKTNEKYENNASTL